MAQFITLAKELLHHTYEQEKIAELQHQYEQQASDRRHYQLLAYLFGLLLLAILMVLVILYFNRRRIEQYNSILDLNAQTIEQAQQRIEVLSMESEAHDKEINRLNDKITSARRSTNERLGRARKFSTLFQPVVNCLHRLMTRTVSSNTIPSATMPPSMNGPPAMTISLPVSTPILFFRTWASKMMTSPPSFVSVPLPCAPSNQG